MEKRGLSEVVTTVLIILLVLAAVVIIWAFVRPAIVKSSSGVTGACAQLDLTVLDCNLGVTPGDAVVSVRKGAADVRVENVVLVFDVGSETERNPTPLGSINQLESRQFVVTLSGTPDRVTATAEVRTEAGELQLCQPIAVKAGCT